MYENFFGFREKPFKLIPNPAYLYLSWSHEEALAHLNYALNQGDGFLAVTGEVGTGKTTLCRSFLEGLDEKTEVAFIFSPMLSAVKLLQAVNDEFGLRSDADDAKTLIDALNAFLLEQKSKGKNVLLLIDEAQNLNREALEQLRLLSNFETTRQKLIQIILVGQPELGELLDSHELRQLGQRVALRSHLSPLTFRETRAYIDHRIHIASMKSAVVFTRSAYKRIFRYAGGIPRLINIVCERALITAFGLNRHKISGGIVKTAVSELPGGEPSRGISRLRFARPALAGSLIFLILAALALGFSGIVNIQVLVDPPGPAAPVTFFEVPTRPDAGASPAELSTQNLPASTAAREMPPAAGAETAAASPLFDPEATRAAAPPPAPMEASVSAAVRETLPRVPDSVVDTVPAPGGPGMGMPEGPEPEPGLAGLVQVLDRMTPKASRRSSLAAAVALWGQRLEDDPRLDRVNDDLAYFRLAANRNQMLIRFMEGNLETVTGFRMPAILECYAPGSLEPVYLTLVGMAEDRVTLTDGGRRFTVEPEDLGAFWSGASYVPWKNFLNIIGTIPTSATRDDIVTLKILLRDIGFRDIDILPVYDARTLWAVKSIQEKYGLAVDGVVGSSTKIALYKERSVFDIPDIISASDNTRAADH